jgi:hypothetical protein
MYDKGTNRIYSTALFLLTKNIINECADDLGLSEDMITDDVIEAIRDRTEDIFATWRESLKNVIRDTIGHEIARSSKDECPLHLTCSAACPYMQIGGCRLPNKLNRK